MTRSVADSGSAFCEGVKAAAVALGIGLLRHPSNERLRSDLASGALSAGDLGHQVLIIIYRLLFLLVAEARAGLHTQQADQERRQSFAAQYSIGRLRPGEWKPADRKDHGLWRSFQRLSGWLAQESGCPDLGLPALTGALFRPSEAAALSECELTDADLLRIVRALTVAKQGQDRVPVDFSTLPTALLGSAYAWLLELHPQVDLDSRAFGLEPAAGHARRTTGSYYTPEPLIEAVLALALDPLLDQACAGQDPAKALLELTVCDPACGSGHFLLAAARRIASRLQKVRGAPCSAQAAFREVLERCIFGVDLNPMAIELCKAVLWLEAGDPGLAMSFLDHRLLCGNSLIGATPLQLQGSGDSRAADRWCAGILVFGAPGFAAPARQASQLGELHRFLHWHLAFPDVFRARPGASALDPVTGRSGGFDCVIGNPPWIAHAGRAAQPIDPPVRAFHELYNPAFASYKSTHGMFVYMAATLLRPKGRLGLVIPTSVSDLDGYRPVRQAHDQLCTPLASLPDFGDVFQGVFQPCMALVSVRRERPCDAPGSGGPWDLARGDLSEGERALLAMLSALPTLPASLFGERGLQTTAEMRKAIVEADGAVGACTLPLREGTDVREFETRAPRHHADPVRLAGELRTAEAWRSVAILLRQTARWPIASASDGKAFRNSILACFEQEGWDRAVLLCLLNSTLVRWYHYTRFRDARQGMPQVKIGHLRSIPAPTRMSEAVREALRRLGDRLIARNAGIEAEERAHLDDLVFSSYGMSAEQRAIMSAWWQSAPGRGRPISASANES